MTTPGVRPGGPSGGSPGGSAARCAVCEAEAAPDASYCMACGQPLVAPRDPPLAAQRALRELAPMRVVEADVTAPAQPMALAGERAMRLASLPRLAALAWRQPAVRSVVTTGASAVALSLVWRVAGAALRGEQARRALLHGSPSSFSPGAHLDPLVEELLRDATPGKRLSKRLSRRAGTRAGRRGVVVAELVYVRRVFRR